MLSRHARNEWLAIGTIGVLLTVTALVVQLWWLAALIVVACALLIAFFRDPNRDIPVQRNVVVAPADGRVSSVHEVDHYEPFDGPATCIRIFLSVFNVHINRSPCHGEIASIKHTAGAHRNALNPESAEDNEQNLIVMIHPIRRQPIAAVRQVAGLLARTIVCHVREGQVVQRGERIGLIKLGSTTELYVPQDLKPDVQVQQGQKVQAGSTVLAHLAGRTSPEDLPAGAPTEAIAQQTERAEQDAGENAPDETEAEEAGRTGA